MVPSIAFSQQIQPSATPLKEIPQIIHDEATFDARLRIHLARRNTIIEGLTKQEPIYTSHRGAHLTPILEGRG